MSKQGKPGRPKSGVETQVIYLRLEKSVVEALDELGATMAFKPKRVQLIQQAIKELLDRHKPGQK